MDTGELNAWGNPAMDQHPIHWQGGVEVSCYRNRDKLQPDGPVEWYADLTVPLKFEKKIRLSTSTSMSRV